MHDNEVVHRLMVIAEVTAARNHQVRSCFDTSHDDQHTDGELATGAAAYALDGWMKSGGVILETAQAGTLWPWADYWKPRTHRENCVRAAAMLIAEIERIDRAAEKERERRSWAGDGPTPGG
jgi:hypothetical protein